MSTSCISTPSLFQAMVNGHTKTVSVYMKSILNSELQDIEKATLLSAIYSFKNQGLFKAMENGHKETVKLYIDTIIHSGLTSSIKLLLLKVRKNNLSKRLINIHEKGLSELVTYYINEVKLSNLDLIDKKYLYDEIQVEVDAFELLLRTQRSHNTETISLSL